MRLLAILILILTLIPSAVSADTHEVNMSYVRYDPLSGGGFVSINNITWGSWCKLGQKLDIPNRYVTSIGYHVWKFGNPTGDIILSIYNATSDEIIFSQVWGSASNLSVWGAVPNLIEVPLTNPTCINGTVRICVEYYGGDMDNYCGGGYFTGDRITGEYYTNYRYGQWHDIGEAEEGAYYYTWVDEEDLRKESRFPLWIIAPIGAGVGGLVFIRRKRAKS